MRYTVTLLTTEGETVATYYNKDGYEVNGIIANTLKDGYPIPEFNGIAQELNGCMDIRIEEQADDKDQACGYDEVLDQRHSNSY